MPEKRTLKLLLFASLVFITIACSTRATNIETGLKATVDAQSTQIALLSTRVAESNLTNQSQWDAISALSTQMPLALGLITPIPDEVSPTPTPWIDIEYPSNTRTGNPEIDHVIDIFVASDLKARVELARLIQFPCTTTDGLGGPPKCNEGETDGTMVTVFPVLYTEGTHVRPENLQSVFDFTIRGLFAVYAVPESAYQAEYWPIGEYAIVFTSEDGGYSHIITLHVFAGEIIRLDFSMDWPPFEHVWCRSDTFILPPSTR